MLNNFILFKYFIKYLYIIRKMKKKQNNKT